MNTNKIVAHAKTLAERIECPTWEAKQIISRLKRSKYATEKINGYVVRMTSDSRTLLVRAMHEMESENGQASVALLVIILLIIATAYLAAGAGNPVSSGIMWMIETFGS